MRKTYSPWFDVPRNVAFCETTASGVEAMGSVM